MNTKISLFARIFLGLVYFVFGLNGLFPFLPMTPPPMPEAAETFMKGMMAASYFFPVLKLTETLGGLMLLSGFAAPLALVVLAPITLHILLFHGLMTPGLKEIILPSIMVISHILAAIAYWPIYRPLFGKGK